MAATLAVLVGVPILSGLGLWQLARGHEKARLLEAAARGSAAEPVDFSDLASYAQVQGYRPVRVRGEFRADLQGLLENQVRDGQVGYDILTPLQVEGRAELLLVDRGWLPRGGRREDVPQWQTPGETVTLVGTLRAPVDVPLVSGEITDRFRGVWVVSEIDPAALGKQLDAPIAPRVLRLAAESEHGFRRDWPVVAMTPQRHYGYAVQWFGLAAALLGLYGVAGVRRARAGDGSED